MTEVLHSPSQFASSPRRSSSSSSLSCAIPSTSCTAPPNDDIVLINDHQPETPSSYVAEDGCSTATYCDTEEVKDRDKHRSDQLSILALLVTLFRKSLAACRIDRRELCAMEIGWPSDVEHVAHVTFDRFNGFLGLPVEFEPEVPRRPPSASTTVFGVSTESMQLEYDSRGNCVPTILLLMQRRLYAQGGLQVEGIFRITGGNSQEEYVRDQLNRGVVPEGIDVHCLAGLIKAWFRELPSGILDSLSPEQEDLNKMNARNIAMVFAPNMTQMVDPLTALMYAVQVMDFLKTLILRTLRQRKESVVESSPDSCLDPSDENGHEGPSLPCLEDTTQDNEEIEQNFVSKKPSLESSSGSHHNDNLTGGEADNSCLVTSSAELISDGALYCAYPPRGNSGKSKTGQSSNSSSKKGYRKTSGQQPFVQGMLPVEKTKGISNLSRIDSRTERIEAWR
ncbi:Rho GTPase-activating protein [Quillaja saponaria]|uniref:Rho GTPase-activating protein n=1 Tax=Quillaja saponaria TaxID=32244 RepID=A0AAD7QGM0_QUISA|nr:Rho GTPase-activating protein [Quillaja saponaria]